MISCIGLSLISLSQALPAQTYPAKPIHIIAQFTPGTSTDILARLVAQKMSRMVRILNQPDVKERLAALAFTPAGDTRQEFAAFIKSEIAKWGKAVKESGAKAD